MNTCYLLSCNLGGSYVLGLFHEYDPSCKYHAVWRPNRLKTDKVICRLKRFWLRDSGKVFIVAIHILAS